MSQKRYINPGLRGGAPPLDVTKKAFTSVKLQPKTSYERNRSNLPRSTATYQKIHMKKSDTNNHNINKCESQNDLIQGEENHATSPCDNSYEYELKLQELRKELEEKLIKSAKANERVLASQCRRRRESLDSQDSLREIEDLQDERSKMQKTPIRDTSESMDTITRFTQDYVRTPTRHTLDKSIGTDDEYFLHNVPKYPSNDILPRNICITNMEGSQRSRKSHYTKHELSEKSVVTPLISKNSFTSLSTRSSVSFSSDDSIVSENLRSGHPVEPLSMLLSNDEEYAQSIHSKGTTISISYCSDYANLGSDRTRTFNSKNSRRKSFNRKEDTLSDSYDDNRIDVSHRTRRNRQITQKKQLRERSPSPYNRNNTSHGSKHNLKMQKDYSCRQQYGHETKRNLIPKYAALEDYEKKEKNHLKKPKDKKNKPSTYTLDYYSDERSNSAEDEGTAIEEKFSRRKPKSASHVEHYTDHKLVSKWNQNGIKGTDSFEERNERSYRSNSIEDEGTPLQEKSSRRKPKSASHIEYQTDHKLVSKRNKKIKGPDSFEERNERSYRSNSIENEGTPIEEKSARRKPKSASHIEHQADHKLVPKRNKKLKGPDSFEERNEGSYRSNSIENEGTPIEEKSPRGKPKSASHIEHHTDHKLLSKRNKKNKETDSFEERNERSYRSNSIEDEGTAIDEKSSRRKPKSASHIEHQTDHKLVSKRNKKINRTDSVEERSCRRKCYSENHLGRREYRQSELGEEYQRKRNKKGVICCSSPLNITMSQHRNEQYQKHKKTKNASRHFVEDRSSGNGDYSADFEERDHLKYLSSRSEHTCNTPTNLDTTYSKYANEKLRRPETYESTRVLKKVPSSSDISPKRHTNQKYVSSEDDQERLFTKVHRNCKVKSRKSSTLKTEQVSTKRHSRHSKADHTEQKVKQAVECCVETSKKQLKYSSEVAHVKKRDHRCKNDALSSDRDSHNADVSISKFSKSTRSVDHVKSRTSELRTDDDDTIGKKYFLPVKKDVYNLEAPKCLDDYKTTKAENKNDLIDRKRSSYEPVKGNDSENYCENVTPMSYDEYLHQIAARIRLPHCMEILEPIHETVSQSEDDTTQKTNSAVEPPLNKCEQNIKQPQVINDNDSKHQRNGSSERGEKSSRDSELYSCTSKCNSEPKSHAYYNETVHHPTAFDGPFDLFTNIKRRSSFENMLPNRTFYSLPSSKCINTANMPLSRQIEIAAYKAEKRRLYQQYKYLRMLERLQNEQKEAKCEFSATTPTTPTMPFGNPSYGIDDERKLYTQPFTNDQESLQSNHYQGITLGNHNAENNHYNINDGRHLNRENVNHENLNDEQNANNKMCSPFGEGINTNLEKNYMSLPTVQKDIHCAAQRNEYIYHTPESDSPNNKKSQKFVNSPQQEYDLKPNSELSDVSTNDFIGTEERSLERAKDHKTNIIPITHDLSPSLIPENAKSINLNPEEENKQMLASSSVAQLECEPEPIMLDIALRTNNMNIFAEIVPKMVREEYKKYDELCKMRDQLPRPQDMPPPMYSTMTQLRQMTRYYILEHFDEKRLEAEAMRKKLAENVKCTEAYQGQKSQIKSCSPAQINDTRQRKEGGDYYAEVKQNDDHNSLRESGQGDAESSQSSDDDQRDMDEGDERTENEATSYTEEEYEEIPKPVIEKPAIKKCLQETHLSYEYPDSKNIQQQTINVLQKNDDVKRSSAFPPQVPEVKRIDQVIRIVKHVEPAEQGFLVQQRAPNQFADGEAHFETQSSDVTEEDIQDVCKNTCLPPQKYLQHERPPTPIPLMGSIVVKDHNEPEMRYFKNKTSRAYVVHCEGNMRCRESKKEKALAEKPSLTKIHPSDNREIVINTKSLDQSHNSNIQTVPYHTSYDDSSCDTLDQPEKVTHHNQLYDTGESSSANSSLERKCESSLKWETYPQQYLSKDDPYNKNSSPKPELPFQNPISYNQNIQHSHTETVDRQTQFSAPPSPVPYQMRTYAGNQSSSYYTNAKPVPPVTTFSSSPLGTNTTTGFTTLIAQAGDPVIVYESATTNNQNPPFCAQLSLNMFCEKDGKCKPDEIIPGLPKAVLENLENHHGLKVIVKKQTVYAVDENIKREPNVQNVYAIDPTRVKNVETTQSEWSVISPDVKSSNLQNPKVTPAECFVIPKDQRFRTGEELVEFFKRHYPAYQMEQQLARSLMQDPRDIERLKKQKKFEAEQRLRWERETARHKIQEAQYRRQQIINYQRQLKRTQEYELLEREEKAFKERQKQYIERMKPPCKLAPIPIRPRAAKSPPPKPKQTRQDKMMKKALPPSRLELLILNAKDRDWKPRLTSNPRSPEDVAKKKELSITRSSHSISKARRPSKIKLNRNKVNLKNEDLNRQPPIS